MMVIEMREDAKERALDLIDESKDLHRQQKMVMCELEDALYDCFEAEEKEDEEGTDEGTDLGFKGKMGRRSNMRNFEDKDYDNMERPYSYRMRMRMRRNRMLK